MFYLNKHWQKKSINTSNHFSILPPKDLYKGTSEALVLPERERRSKSYLYGGEGKRKRFPWQTFAEKPRIPDNKNELRKYDKNKIASCDNLK